jgi:hypothetical protein
MFKFASCPGSDELSGFDTPTRYSDVVSIVSDYDVLKKVKPLVFIIE